MLALINCCADDWDTRFCGNCGKLLRRHSVLTLLGHCKLHRDCNEGRREYSKWAAWVDDLEDLLMEVKDANETPMKTSE
jgi:hypothetical protein